MHSPPSMPAPLDDHPDRTRFTQLCAAAQGGDPRAAAELLPLVYDELRRLAASRMGRLEAGRTLQATALVHEAYLKLVGPADPGWNGRRHFFGAAAQAMRDVLVDEARRRGARKRGGSDGARRVRIGLTDVDRAAELPTPPEDLLALNAAIERLVRDDPRKGEIVMLRYFGGLQRDEIAAVLGVTARTIDREWRYIVARLHGELASEPSADG